MYKTLYSAGAQWYCHHLHQDQFAYHKWKTPDQKTLQSLTVSS